MPFWITVAIVAGQCALTITTTLIDRSKMDPVAKMVFQGVAIALAVAGTTATLRSSWSSRERVARLEAVAPIENDLGELVFRGEPLEQGKLMSIRSDGSAVPAVILRTPKSVLADKCLEAFKAKQYDDALAAAEAALAIDPDFAFVRATRGVLRGIKGDIEGGQADARWVLRHSQRPKVREVAEDILKTQPKP